jgi:hypothetical protein
MRILPIGILIAQLGAGPTGQQTQPGAEGECAAPRPAWIWCDDFEEDRLARYFEHDAAGGRFARVAGVGTGGSWGMRASWTRPGQVGAGALHLAFGRTPDPHIRPVDGGDSTYREVYWRVYLRHQPGWIGGGGNKLSRAIVLATPVWAEAVLAAVWSGSRPRDRDLLMIDPASGTDAAGVLRTAKYNDFPNLRWLGPRPGRTPIFATGWVGRWYCIEAHVRLNSRGRSDGVFRLWIDGRLEAERSDLNWVGTYDDYGVNAVFLENYWNQGAPRAQERYFDRFVVSTAPIGC